MQLYIMRFRMDNNATMLHTQMTAHPILLSYRRHLLVDYGREFLAWTNGIAALQLSIM